jgi:hypothetical protein
MSGQPALPSLPLSLARAAAPWKRAATASTILPVQSAQLLGWRPNSSALGTYRRLVGSSAELPFLYPQVPVMALTLDLVSRWTYPIRAMGMVHVGSVVECLESISSTDPWDLDVKTSAGRHVRAGLEFDVVGEVSVGGTVRWRSRAVYLSRSRSAAGAQDSTVPRFPAGVLWQDEASFEAEEGIGRAFGMASGDLNPIHLHSATARLFGFKRAIAHGWWTTGRVPALLGLDEARPGRRLEVAYRRPIELPSRPLVHSRRGEDEVDFAVMEAAASATGAAEQPLVRGRVSV